MPARPESSIFDSAALVMLHSGARPMVDGVAQADVSGLSHKNDFALARSLGDWRDARQALQGVVISPSQRIRGFCEQRGEDDPSNARQGSQDRHVTLLIEWNNKAVGFVGYGGNGGARSVEILRQVVSNVELADVRAQVGLSLFTDFENSTTFKPDPHLEPTVTGMLDQVIAWGSALKPLRTPKSD